MDISVVKKIKNLTSRILNYGQVPPIVNSVRSASLTYLDTNALTDLYHLAIKLDQTQTPGIFVETGCALGGSAIVITQAKNIDRPFYVYDVFGMIPPPSEKDGADVLERYKVISSGRAEGIGGNKYYGYEDQVYELVIENFWKNHLPIDEHNVHLVKGLFADTLSIDKPVALAHIDSDWYESVMTCLERIAPVMVQNGVIVIDDYDAWSGCRRAVDEYFMNKKKQFRFERKSRLQIRRI